MVPDSTRIGFLMAREIRFRIARAYSQLVPRLIPRGRGEVAPAQHVCGRVGFDGLEGEELPSERTDFNGEAEARQGLAPRNVAQLEGEALQR